jgi:hypothetical protein
MGARRWIACPGSGKRPTEIAQTRTGLLGVCPVCHRWLGVTKRSEKVHHHAVDPPKLKR